MVPMETFPSASKEPSLVMTLELMPSFQPLCLCLSSGLPLLLPATTVEISPQSSWSLPNLLIQPAGDSQPRLPSFAFAPIAFNRCPGKGTKPHFSSGPFPLPLQTLYLNSQSAGQVTCLPPEYPLTVLLSDCLWTIQTPPW